MSWKIRFGIGLSGCLLFTMTFLLNAQEPRVQIQVRKQEGREAQPVRRLSWIMGGRVMLQGSREVGKVEDIVLNEAGCAEYVAVLIQDKYTLVPWEAAKIDFGRKQVTVNLAAEKFQEVPTFTAETWPNLTDRVYVDKIYKYYGVTPREHRIERREDRRNRR